MNNPIVFRCALTKSRNVVVAIIAILAVMPDIGLAQMTRGSKGPPEQAKVKPINDELPNPYTEFRDWGKLPDGRKWGSVSALHIDIDGKHLWVAERCGANSCVGSKVDPILKLDPDGNVVKSFGAGMLAWPHGMEVDAEGNVWVVDARLPNARELQQFPDAKGIGNQVIKFSPEGKVLMVIGTPGEAGDPPTHLNAPNDVLVAPDGSIFIGETHSAQFQDEPGPNAISRVSKYSADGKFIKSWGPWGFKDGETRSPHALAMDSKGRLFVSDRGNRRIQIFDQNGKHLDTWYQFSRISGLFIDANDMLYAVDSESDDNYNPGWSKGLRVGSAVTGEVKYFVPAHESPRPSGMGGIGSMGEGVTVDKDGIIYVGEVGPIKGLTKYVKSK